jgi:uncharacterized protein YjbI with pentapeptide repeats
VLNPYSLAAGVNEASASARTAWLLSLAVMAWLFIAIAGVSHRDLLMGGGVALPLLQVEIDIRRLFIFAPIVLLFLQFGLLMLHALLAQKLTELDSALRAEEEYGARDHPLRLELDSHFLTQILAGPERPPWLERLQHIMSWLSFVFFPVLLLLVIHSVFLPARDPALTWVHRGALVAYILLIVLVGVFIMRPARDWGRSMVWVSDHRPVSVFATASLFALALFYSFAVATNRDGVLDRRLGWIVDGILRYPFLDPAWVRPPRSLNLRGVDLTRTVKEQGDRILDLRDRDLRFADFAGAVLRQAEFSGSHLDNARFTGADLRSARFGCKTEFERMTRKSTDSCVSLRHVDMTGADLRGAVFEFADLEDAILSAERLAEAEVKPSNLTGVTLYGSISPPVRELPGVNLAGSRLDRANLALVDLRRASFANAHLVGAILTAAQLNEADLSGADLSKADLSGADLRGANLTGANLTGANLSEALLAGARITEAQLRMARKVEAPER